MMEPHPSTAEGIKFLPPDEAAGFEGTIEHLARKNIQPSEVDEVFWEPPVWLRNKKNRRASWRMLGRTVAGRALDIKIMWDPEGEPLLVPVTGWRAADADVNKYL
ncbi:hypothetical protein GCM10023201_53810 [Actinomycetospora corticicola]|uniref:Uncharacterized protein n=1 Tax=Actinomycetospora corticicola TaxID=663602 RepID=A0A7Y9E004_9PSEU|nr:hypothetical protein [Actinomycetospora corticicola]NYD38562.1 hypothetical protein [Actinomycetospora corticicola]